MSGAYYNEHDRFAAAWLRELIADGLIAPGEVDERSIEDVLPSDLAGFVQCHWFAGIGVWSLALRQAGWPDDRPIWTGSCPCQPFSAAGKGGGFADERHLWPVWFRLIETCRPPLVLGEQVASNLATGGRPTADVHGLWEEQAALRVLKDRMAEHLSPSLQDLSERTSARIQQARSVIDGDAREQDGGLCEIKSDAEGAAFRSGRALGSGASGCRQVRGDGAAVQPLGETGLGHSVARSEASRGRIHESEYASHPNGVERGLWSLGRISSPGNGAEGHERPARCIEQAIARTSREIEGANGSSWLNTLQIDLEGIDYIVGSCVTAACSVGAPHIRQRLYWMADAARELDNGCRNAGTGRWPEHSDGGDIGRVENAELPAGARQRPFRGAHLLNEEAMRLAGRGVADQSRDAGADSRLLRGEDRGLAHTNGWNASAERQQRGGEQRQQPQDGGAGGMAGADREREGPLGGLRGGQNAEPQRGRETGGMELAGGVGWERREAAAQGHDHDGPASDRPQGEHGLGLAMPHRLPERPGPLNGLWRDADWLCCTDGKWRPVAPGTFPLAPTGTVRNRVGTLRGAGNAINLAQAQGFIEAVIDVRARLELAA